MKELRRGCIVPPAKGIFAVSESVADQKSPTVNCQPLI